TRFGVPLPLSSETCNRQLLLQHLVAWRCRRHETVGFQPGAMPLGEFRAESWDAVHDWIGEICFVDHQRAGKRTAGGIPAGYTRSQLAAAHGITPGNAIE